MSNSRQQAACLTCLLGPPSYVAVNNATTEIVYIAQDCLLLVSGGLTEWTSNPISEREAGLPWP